MELKEIKTGDTLYVSDKKSFVSRTIVKVMKHYAKKKKIKYDFIFSHAARFIWIADKLYVYGSIDSGYKPWVFENHYSLNDPDKPCAISRRKTKLSKEEEKQTTHYCQHLVTVSLAYQYWALFLWLLLAYLNIDLFRNDSDNFTYCYEAEEMCRKNLNPANYGQTYKTDFFMLCNDPNYDVIFKSNA